MNSPHQRDPAPENAASDNTASLNDSSQPTNGCGTHACYHSGVFGKQTELIFAGLAGAFLVSGWILAWSLPDNHWPAWGCYVAAYFFGGWYMVWEAIEKLSSGRFEIDFLMLFAAVGAALLDKWAEGALLLFLFSVGHALEHYAMGRATQAIEALAKLAPRTAWARRNGDFVEVGVEELLVDDVVLVKPNSRVSADGFVVSGESSVDQAPITGESVPVDKQPVPDPQAARLAPEKLAAMHRVFAGTVNGSGALEIQVTKLARENTLARVVQMVAAAEKRTSPTQQLTNNVQKYFVPAVLVFVVLLHFAWLILDEAFAESFYRAMAVLVAASPCALAIATPSAVLSGVARAARSGVLVKGGGPLESLGGVEAIAFDKTGTLTEGKPQLTDVRSADEVELSELLRISVAAESLSDHPLAMAVVLGARERIEQLHREQPHRGFAATIPSAYDFQSVTGRGLSARVDGQSVWVGKLAWFEELDDGGVPTEIRSVVAELEQAGRTTMVVRYGDRHLGVLGLMDQPRAMAKTVIERLRQLGVQRMVMVSGDNQVVASAVGKALGLDVAMGDLMPADKVREIQRLGGSGGVAMVGDGVNDAPAMAGATVGIAMGAAGSEVALESSDIALMGDDLQQLPFAVGLSRMTSRIIRQNLWLSLGMVAVLVPATLFGLRMGPAVLFHEGSTLAVVLNALRLLAYRDQTNVETDQLSQ